MEVLLYETAIILFLYQAVGLVLGALYYSDQEDSSKLKLTDWIFFVPGAALSAISFLMLPVAVVIGTVPMLLDVHEHPIALSFLILGWYMCISFYIVMKKLTTN